MKPDINNLSKDEIVRHYGKMIQNEILEDIRSMGRKNTVTMLTPDMICGDRRFRESIPLPSGRPDHELTLTEGIRPFISSLEPFREEIMRQMTLSEDGNVEYVQYPIIPDVKRKAYQAVLELRKAGVFSHITDSVEWQRQMRADWD